MFDQLSERLQSTLSEVRSRGKLSESDVDSAMREIRLALLEADVNFKVVKAFTKTLKERCLGEDVLSSLDPGQQVVKIVNEELASLMGGTGSELAMAASGPTVILMAGLQGSGKTTACAKLAQFFGKQGKDVALAACDVYRPAAVEQLVTMGQRAGAHVYEQGTEADPVDIASWAFDEARAERRDVLVIDTAGRLHIDQDLMAELAKIRKQTRPHDVLLVVDAMTGQDAVGVAESFAEVAEFDGVVMTKLDGDARGGAALSVKAVTGKPILFASTGEKIEDFDKFHPDRMSQRILGMGDVLSLIEKAEQQVDEEEAEALQEKMRRDQFTLEDFLKQMKQVRKMGPLSGILGMLPGMGSLKQLKNADVDERELDRVEAIILSMTPRERANPGMINGSRRKRIAAGSGTKVQQVNNLVKQFDQMKVMMKAMANGRMPTPQQMSQLASGGQRAPRPKMRRR
ncbi:MAG TPA: signal recognition particle protein [Solirubrobacterales bacterium]|jgi:signal recognition particle subunit SRP54|nr:signal recognition particle protein [Solirubrobacterales bacterium]